MTLHPPTAREAEYRGDLLADETATREDVVNVLRAEPVRLCPCTLPANLSAFLPEQVAYFVVCHAPIISVNRRFWVQVEKAIPRRGIRTPPFTAVESDYYRESTYR